MIRAIIAAVLSCAAATQSCAETCIASWYGRESGPRTASGERFHPDGISCAHKTRPFGQVVTVTHLGNGRTVRCRINDRGPFIKGRCIDLSAGAARAIGMNGTAQVRVE
ncbi:septal ring lytic transglycosylase RlpA family protein [Bradyrhizobium sp. INPA03-11B]|uniref:septal ring lytic transglycosylase RlpA family protein n=1 Tax=Bradyrhizobium sp. INPA03-11B TaxID=418598 RepID=UPI00338F3FAC